MPCSIHVASEEYADFIATYSSSPEELIESAAVLSGLSGLLAEKLLLLEGKTLEDVEE